MAKLHFFYSSMNAGKSTALLQSNHNFEENNVSTLLFLPETNKQQKASYINSRIGIKRKAIVVNNTFDFYKYIDLKPKKKLKFIFVDEAQFLTKDQVNQLSSVADKFEITVMCYGLRTNFKGELFDGSSRLLSISDTLTELKTICSYCTKKATMTIKTDKDGYVNTKGKSINVKNKDIYKPVCRNHFKEMTNLF